MDKLHKVFGQASWYFSSMEDQAELHIQLEPEVGQIST